MTDTAAAQLRRILALVPELADDEAHPIERLATALATDRATLLGDLRSLTERFDPGGFVDEGVGLFIDGECVSLTSPHFRRPMRLTATELCALELGLAMLETERPPEEHAAIVRARRRLRDVITRLPATSVESGSRVASLAAGDAAHLGVLRDAVRLRRKVRLGYRRGDHEAATGRVVDPYALVVASGMWYAIAFCERSTGLRVFRLDRVEQATLLDTTFEVPATFSLERVVGERRVLHADGAATMTVRYSPRIARWIAEREGGTLGEDGSLTMEHPVLDVAWGVRHVLQYGPDAEVLSPPHVRNAVIERLGALRSPGADA
jgi:proteasome accessory factor C